jgi:hypothetical protein
MKTLGFSQRERIRAAFERRAAKSPRLQAVRLRRLANNSRGFDKFVEAQTKIALKANPNATEKGIVDEIIKLIESGALEKLMAIVMKFIQMFTIIAVALMFTATAEAGPFGFFGKARSGYVCGPNGCYPAKAAPQQAKVISPAKVIRLNK